MSEGKQQTEGLAVLGPELLEQLRRISIFATLTAEQMHCLATAEVLHAGAGEVMIRQGEESHFFWILLEGGVRVWQSQKDGPQVTIATVTGSEAFGEIQLLSGVASAISTETTMPSSLLRLSEDAFWKLMTMCPEIRKAILGKMAIRMQRYQSEVVQREKLVSLGTLAAGLMHELNNPGSAAKRAASQLRENMARMQQMSMRLSRAATTPQEKQCMLELQERALSVVKPKLMSSLEQSDAEQELADWLEAHSIENAWKIAPTLVSIGMAPSELECALSSFSQAVFSDALNWLEALVSSMTLAATVEESIGRITELVRAVKMYAYEGKGQKQQIDVNESLHSTLIILAHKFKQKEIEVTKELAPNLPPLSSAGTGLNQVWTNILDNAVDAVAQGGKIQICTGTDGREICVSIRDDGPGIPPESQPHIFEPFYTTKDVGVGTGLGLDIAHRIVTAQYGGAISFTSQPGATEFVVHLPIRA
jgi:signal transduction histidine kinase